MTKIAYEKAQVICIVHQCGAQLRLSLNDKKNVEVKGGKEKLTNKEKFPTILTCNQIILKKQW